MVSQNTFVSLPVNWNLVYVRTSPKIAFWTFSPRRLLTFAPQGTANTKIRLYFEPFGLLSLLMYVSPSGSTKELQELLFAIIRHTEYSPST